MTTAAFPAHGFTLLELALALTVIGVLAWLGAATFANLTPVADRATALAHGEEVRSHMRAFALSHGRLPCPDRSEDGLEDLDEGQCPVNQSTGWLPYVSLNMPQPAPELRAYYGVFRAADDGEPATDADLARAIRRQPGSGPVASGDLVRALLNGQRLAPDPAQGALLTGTGRNDDALDCSENPVRHVAWFAVVPLQDRNGSGNRLDSVHDVDGFPDCAFSPATPPASDRDDVVIAETFSGLAGWLQQHAATRP